MTNQEIISKMLEAKKGSYVKLLKQKDLGNNCKKISEMVIRLGVSYANLKENKGKEIQPLKWGHWVEGLVNYVIEHEKDGIKKYYLRVTDNGNNVKSKSTYYMNNKEVSLEELRLSGLVKEKDLGSEKSPVYNIKFENILELNY